MSKWINADALRAHLEYVRDNAQNESNSCSALGDAVGNIMEQGRANCASDLLLYLESVTGINVKMTVVNDDGAGA